MDQTQLLTESFCPVLTRSGPRGTGVFLRRDYESRPLKLQLLSEIKAYPHRTDPDWLPEADAPIDYCYVRPNHIPSVNAMCHDTFWPGN